MVAGSDGGSKLGVAGLELATWHVTLRIYYLYATAMNMR